MSSKVIKFVAGAGKTTESVSIMNKEPNGLYLAFTNSVVEEVYNKGFLSKTIDSLFSSFIIPKFIPLIPIISLNSEIRYVNDSILTSKDRGIMNINIDLEGKIYNRSKYLNISLDKQNNKLHKMDYAPSIPLVKKIFSEGCLYMSDQLRSDISNYILNKYPDEVVDFLSSRFSYIIIDEAQDLKGFKEDFAKLIFESSLKVYILGDENQNINGGGNWFGSLEATECNNVSYRSPEMICEWIREHLNIEIHGSDKVGSYNQIKSSEIGNYNRENCHLIYNSRTVAVKKILENWKGKHNTIKSVKGSTIENDILIVGSSLNCKNFYTAVTRTTKNVYSTVTKINN